MQKNNQFPECGILGELVSRWSDKEGAFDDNAYAHAMDNLRPEHLVEFLHHTFCTFPAANRFLVDALKLAQDHGWET